nr:glycerophosphodiester phosphodiesterase family protein [Phytoactinopolyspora alkaliphila]
MTGFINVGHRGSSGLAPENTIAGLELAAMHQPDVVEVDVQLSADGQPILFHDTTGARTTNVATVFPSRASHPITTFTYAELQQLDAGSWFGPAFAGEKIPLLSDVLDELYPDVGVVIEIKEPASSPGIEQVIADELAADPRWDDLLDDGLLMATSFDASSLQTLRTLHPDIPLGLVGAIPSSNTTLNSIATWADEMVTNYRLMDPADIARVKAAGMRFGVYTVNDPDHMANLLSQGVDTIMTDFPKVLEDVQANVDPLPGANGIEIVCVNADVPGSDLTANFGENLALRNNGSTTVNVSGYYVRDAVINELVVGSGYSIPPGGELRIYTGPGTNASTRYFNNLGTAVLNNNGDSLALYTSTGELIDLYAYRGNW